MILPAFALALFLGSAAQTTPQRAAVGSEAPSLTLASGEKSISLSQMRGEYVLVNFWSSDDPASRIANALYDRQAPCIKRISICTDPSRSQFEQIVTADALKRESQYYFEDAGVQGLLAAYRPVGINTAYLIDPQGRVVAVNPSIERVNELTQQRAA